MPLASPGQMLEEMPLEEERTGVVVRGRDQVEAILNRQDDRLLVVVGPCSVHDMTAARDYAGAAGRQGRGPARRPLHRDARVLREAAHHDRLEGADQRPAPRRLRGREHRAADGAPAAARDPGPRLPVGCEFLDPITPQYISDTVAWGAIGARTTESQIHRQLGSGLSMPVGFKNRTDGNVQVAVDAVRAASVPHAFAGVDEPGTRRSCTPRATSTAT